jgi:O-antigen chain-terminating methyltransferase
MNFVKRAIRFLAPGQGAENPDVATMRAEALQQFSDLERRIEYLERYSADIARDVQSLETSALPNLAQYTADIARDLQELEASARPMFSRLDAAPYTSTPPAEFTSSRSGTEGFDYVGFESVFRGPEELVRKRQEVYAPFFVGRTSVLDVGCGRGEFLELMRDRDVPVTGVDLNSAMVALCRAKGFANIHEADAVAWLDQSVGEAFDAIFSAQFIEHVPFESLVRFVARSYRRLASGGVFIAETVNPQSIDAFKTFYVDPSHVRPLFPEVMAFLCRSVGFGEVRVFYPNGGGFDEANPSSQNEYAIVASK